MDIKSRSEIKKQKQSQHETHDDHHEQQQRRHHRLHRTRNNHTLDEQQHAQEAKNINISLLMKQKCISGVETTANIQNKSRNSTFQIKTHDL